MRLGRTWPTAGIAVTLLLLTVLPAHADGWGNVNCGEGGNPACDLSAGKRGGAPPRAGQAPPVNPGKGKSHSPGGPQQSPGDRVLGDASRADCAYIRSDYQPPANGVQTVALRSRPGSGGIQPVAWPAQGRTAVGRMRAQGEGGAWYVYRCSGPGVRDGLYRAPVWIADGQEPGAAALPSPEELAQQARSQLRLPSPRIVSNPAGTQLVRLPTWLWLERGSWGTRSATASVPGVSVTAVARPTSVSWSMGDGAEFTCAGPGTPFPAGGNPRAASPDCGHTYHRSSARAPGATFAVSATVHWTVTWSGAGTGGTFPDMTTTASASLRVAEAQALGTGNR